MRIARELTDRCRALNAEIRALEGEVGAMAGALAPELLALPGLRRPHRCRASSARRRARRASRSAARFAMHSRRRPRAGLERQE